MSYFIPFRMCYASAKASRASFNSFLLGQIISITSNTLTTARIHTDKLPAAEDALNTRSSWNYGCFVIFFNNPILALFRVLMNYGLNYTTLLSNLSFRINFFAQSQQSLILIPVSRTFYLTKWSSLNTKQRASTTLAAERGGLGKDRN